MRGLTIVAAVSALLLFFVSAGAMNKWLLPPLGGPRAEEGCEFPDFPLTDTEGNAVWFNDFRGRPLLVSFCSCYTDTSCAVVDSLERIRKAYNTNLLTIIVCCETAPALAKDEYKRLSQICCDAADLVLIDPLGETIKPFRVEILPTTYLIDGDFCVRQRVVDVAGLNAPAFHESVRTLLEEFPGP